MRAFIALTLAVFAAIGLGVAVEPLPSSFPVPVVAHAINKTFAVRSIEVSQTASSPTITHFQGPQSRAIYEAPDRYEGPAAIESGSGTTNGESNPRFVIIGHDEYVLSVNGVKGQGILQFLHQPISRPIDQDGLTPAQWTAFLPLMDAQFATDVRRTKTGWSYKLALHNSFNTVMSGSIEIADGYVRRAMLNEVFKNGVLHSVWTYTHVNSVPQIPTPRIALANP